jgi:hypothetical protein
MRLALLAWAALTVSGILAIAQVAVAQETPEPPAGASGRAVEIGVSGGFVDGWGDISQSSLPHVRSPGAGGQLELDAGWRLLPHLAIGMYGFGAQLSNGFGGQLSNAPAQPQSVDIYAAGAGVQGTWHFRPRANNYDPWLSLGSGWRGQWITNQAAGNTSQDGLDMLRARVGVDLRVSPTVALSPVVGASLGTFLIESVQGAHWSAVGLPTVNTFVFAGVRATVDTPLDRRARARTALGRSGASAAPR